MNERNQQSMYAVSAVLLALAGLLLTAVLLRREFAPPPMSPQATFAAANWEAMVRDGSRIGADSATHVLVVFIDYQCEACRDYDSFLRQFGQERPRQVAIVIRQNPLRAIHPGADAAANAALCAKRMNRFEEVHRALFAQPEWSVTGKWRALGTSSQLPDPEAFAVCVEKRQEAEALARDVALAHDLDIKRAPSVFLDGKPLGSMPTREVLLRELGGAGAR